MAVRTVEWRAGTVVMLDQRLLPTQEVYRVYRDHRDVAAAIKDLVVRGAPAIGVAAAMGIALGSRQLGPRSTAAGFERLCRTFAATRPTAVNLFWAIARMRRVFEANRQRSLDALCTLLEREAQAIHDEDIEINRRMGQHGQAVLERGAVVLTHCNAGALATAGYGTALGVVRAAREAGKRVQVIACETRPYLQGARLTAWELKQDRIPVTLITDNMAAHFMQRGRVNCVIVGADRVAANGDVANKIGTYAHAVVAKRHGIPFYVAAPLSTIDFDCPDGASIPIEERTSREVTHLFERQIAPTGVKAEHPAFDVTPGELVTGIITERGIARRPYARTLARLRRTPLVSIPTTTRAAARSAGKSGVRRQRRS
jgi:methylthioribose-1-phosphate isomerase